MTLLWFIILCVYVAALQFISDFILLEEIVF